MEHHLPHNRKDVIILFYIGIDIAKFSHVFVVMNSSGKIVVPATSFTNDRVGFNSFIDVVKPYINSEHLVGLESIGHYGENLSNFLLDLDCNVTLINPLITNAEAKKKIRKTKTDKLDALAICRLLKNDEFDLLTKPDIDLNEAKQLTRYYFTLSKQLTQQKNRLQKCIDHVFPEYNKLFKTKYSRAYLAILQDFGSAFNVANAKITSLRKAISFSGGGRTVSVDLDLIKETAKSSVGCHSLTVVMEIQHLIQQINLVESQLSQAYKKIEDLAILSQSPIFSIPGIGYLTGMSILSEIGNVRKFESACKLVAFAGVDPGVYQSGEYNANKTNISKRGSPFLRKSLYLAALPAARFNPTLHDYYNLKRSQGKSHRCAQGHPVRKLCRIIFKLLSDNLAFDQTCLS